MRLPGQTAPTYQPDGDDDAFARWMIRQVDKSEEALAIVEIPDTDRSDDLEQLEAACRRALALAQAERPELTARTLGTVPLGAPRPRAPKLLLVLHEHRWVGGECVRGCGEHHQVDSERKAA